MKYIKDCLKGLMFIILFSILSFPAILKSQVKIGLTTGLNMTSLSGDAPSNAGYSKDMGLVLGLSGEFNIYKDLKINLQPRYVQKNGIIFYEFPNEDPVDSFETKLDYVSLPIILKIPALTNNTFFNGGVDLGYLSKASIKRITGDETEADIKESLNEFEVSVLFGFGISFNIFKNFSLEAEARYTQTVSNLAKKSSLIYGDALPERFRSSGFQFLSNIYYTF